MKKTNIKSIYASLCLILLIMCCFSAPASAATPVRIMPLGDSITRGYYGSAHDWGYRKPLYDKLTDANYNYNFVFTGGQVDGNFSDPNHEGHDGWHAAGGTGGGIYPNVYNWLTAHPADIVLLHIGTNDITFDSNAGDANEVNAILNEIDRYSTNIKVVLALIIDRVPNDSRTTQYNNDVNIMAQNRIAAGDDITIVDMQHALNYTNDMSDTVHPNDSGYVKMANVWFNALKSILPPSITSAPVTNAATSQPYSYDVNASGWPKPTYELATHPDGMTIDYNTGLIEWTPTAVGDFNVTVVAGNGQMPDANQSFVINVIHDVNFYDLDNNSVIGWGDVRIMSEHWLQTDENLPGDFYEDNIVNFLDFADFANFWQKQ